MSKEGTFYGKDLDLHFQDSSRVTCMARSHSDTGIEIVNISVDGPVSVSFYLTSGRARALAVDLLTAADKAEGVGL